LAESFLNHKPNGHKLVVDHIDRNRLNNTLDNIRIVTTRENTNWSRGKSRYVGVTLDRGYIYARICKEGKTVHLGSFKTEKAAHERYKQELKILK